MSEFAVLIPSRGRPERFRQTLEAIKDTAPGVDVYLGLDVDDEHFPKYRVDGHAYVSIGERQSLCAWTNKLAKIAMCRSTPPKYLISMGDDHIPRSINWHLALADPINYGPKLFTFGNDGMNHEHLCTAWMTSVEAYEALGWMMLPTLEHMYVDNVIMELGAVTDSLKYIPHVLVEHMHPTIRKAEWDSTYWTDEDKHRKVKDFQSFRNWRFGQQFGRDVLIIDKVIMNRGNY